MLTILLGTKSIPRIDTDMLVFNIKDFNEKELETFKKDGYFVDRINYS